MHEKTENKDDYDKNVKKEFGAFVNRFELDKKGYTISYGRDTINDKLINNCLLSFTLKIFPKDKSKPEMFFSSSICLTECENYSLKTAQTGTVENLVEFEKIPINVDIIIAAKKIFFWWNEV